MAACNLSGLLSNSNAVLLNETICLTFATKAAAKRKHSKTSGLNGIRRYDLCGISVKRVKRKTIFI